LGNPEEIKFEGGCEKRELAEMREFLIQKQRGRCDVRKREKAGSKTWTEDLSGSEKKKRKRGKTRNRKIRDCDMWMRRHKKGTSSNIAKYRVIIETIK